MIIRDLPLIWRLKDHDQVPLPRGVPTRIDFKWDWDHKLGLLRQAMSPLLEVALRAIYAAGSENLGATPNYGKAFTDFLIAICHRQFRNQRAKDTSLLEVSPGSGWLVEKMQEQVRCFTHTGFFGAVGPGLHYTDTRGEVETPGPFDVIVAHHVLEHVADPVGFLRHARTLLTAQGFLVIAVPDCTESVSQGDLSIATPQHLSYFTARSLSRALNVAGFVDGHIIPGDGSLLAVAFAQDTPFVGGGIKPYATPAETFGRFYARAVLRRNQVNTILSCRENLGSYGVYAPMRFLPYVPQIGSFARLFDDGMRGKYLDGVRQKIEGIEDFEADPVDVMFVMSMTHERQIVEKLAGRCKVITLSEMLDG